MGTHLPSVKTLGYLQFLNPWAERLLSVDARRIPTSEARPVDSFALSPARELASISF